MTLHNDLVNSGDCTLYVDFRAGQYKDFSNNNYTVTPTNCVLSKDGLLPTYLTSGYVTIPDCTLFDANKTGTMFFLVKEQSNNGRSIGGFISDGSAGTAYFYLSAFAGDTAYYYFSDGTTTRLSPAAGPVSISQVKSHCVTFQENTASILYMNGLMKAAFNGVNNYSAFGNGDFTIGKGAGSIYSGCIIQAVYVTKTKLTAIQIEQLHNELEAKKWPTKAITNTSVQSLIDPNGALGITPVAAYDFRNGSLRDLVGSNHGTQYGSLDFSKGRYGTGVASPRQGIIKAPISSFTGGLFVSCWFRVDSYTAANQILWSLSPTSDVRYFSLAHFNSVQLGLFDYNTVSNSILYRADNYFALYGKICHAVAGISSDGTVKLWVDGKASTNTTITTESIDARSITTLSINGKYHITSGGGVSMNDGSISNLEIYNQDLTDADVLSIYNRSKRIVSKFDAGLIASGNDFGVGSFVENSQLEYLGTAAGNVEIVQAPVNGYSSKILQTGATNSTTNYARIRSGALGVTPVEAAYGTWQFTMKNASSNTGYYPFVSILANGTTPLFSTRILGTSKDKLQFVRYGGTVLIEATITPDIYHTVRLTRRYDGLWKMWVDGVYIGSATYATYTSSEGITLFTYGPSSENVNIVLQSDNPDYTFWYSPVVMDL